MSRLLYLVFFASIIFMLPSCSKEESEKEENTEPTKPDNPEEPEKPEEPKYPIFDKPSWSVNDKSFEYSMTAIIQLPDSLSSTEKQNDMLAVFKGKECRGTGERIHISDKKYIWMIMVYGDKADEELHFIYYSISSKHKYKSSSTLTFSNDSKFGTVDNPVVVPMVIITDKDG